MTPPQLFHFPALHTLLQGVSRRNVMKGFALYFCNPHLLPSSNPSCHEWRYESGFWKANMYESPRWLCINGRAIRDDPKVQKSMLGGNWVNASQTCKNLSNYSLTKMGVGTTTFWSFLLSFYGAWRYLAGKKAARVLIWDFPLIPLTLRLCLLPLLIWQT